MVTVDCVSPVHKTEHGFSSNLLTDETITVKRIDPEMMFYDSTYFDINVEASPVYNLTSLACKLHDVILPAFYLKDEKATAVTHPTTGVVTQEFKTYFRCRVPSLYFIKMSSKSNIPLDANTGIISEMALEVSLDGQKFSTGGKKFKFLENDYQFRGVSHVTGPATGGTIIDMTLNDFIISNSESPKATCLFAGHEDSKGLIAADSPGRVTAKYIKATTTKKAYITCETPPLLADDKLSAISKSTKTVIPY